MGDNKQKVRAIVEKLLPDTSFYTFKQATYFSKEQNEVEKQEIHRMIEAIQAYGSYNFSNCDEAYLQPILISNDCRDEIIRNLEKTLEFCKEQT